MDDEVSAGASPGDGPGAGRPAQVAAAEVDPGVESLPGTPSHLDPRVRLLWSLVMGGPVAVVGAVLVGVAAFDGLWSLAVGIACLTVAAAAVCVLGARLAWSRWTWTAYEDALELRHGVLVSSSSLVPYHRIQQIDLHRGPFQRVLGLSRLVLRTAAATSDATLPGLGEAVADRLRYQLLRRAGVDDAV